MKKIYLLLLCLMPFFAFSQTNFKPAYVVTATADSLKGYIDYREWELSPTSVRFSTQPDGANTQVFTPSSAKKFSIAGLETFVSFRGSISADRNISPGISTGIDTSTIDATVFVKQLNSGPNVILYKHSDQIKTRFFTSENSKALQELSYHIFVSKTDNEVSETGIFRGQLKVLASAYAPANEGLQRQIDYARYSENTLLKIADQINQTGGKQRTVSGKPIRFFAGAGVNAISTKFTGLNNFSSSPGKTSITPFVNGGIDFFANPAVQQLILRLELSYWYQNASFQVTTSPNSYSTAIENYDLKQSSVAFTPQVLYAVFNKEDSKIYLGFGVALNYSDYHNSRHTVTLTSGTQSVDPYNFKKFWSNFPIEVSGMFNKRIELSFKYYIDGTFSDYSNFNAKSNILSLGAHYLF